MKVTGTPFWWNMNSICCANHWVYKSTLGAFVHQRAKNCSSMTKIGRGQGTHFLSVCTKSEASIERLRPLMQINDWLIFGCKVGQSVQIGMNLKLDMWHHLLNVYTKFQTDISKHVQKSPKNFSLAGSSTHVRFKCLCPPEGQKLPIHDENQQGSRH